MSGTYDLIYRQVALKANLIDSVSASSIISSYANTSMGATQIGERATMFPPLAITDAILNSGGMIVSAIGHNYKSPYRPFFADTSGNIANGGSIGTQSTNSKDRVGIIGEVRDASDGNRCQFKSLQEVLAARDLTTLKQSVYWYFTDNVKIWHTRTNVVADEVIWHRSDQLTLLEASPKGACPFPGDLYTAVIVGALSELMRGTFNMEQAPMWSQKFAMVLDMLLNGSERIQLADKELE